MRQVRTTAASRMLPAYAYLDGATGSMVFQMLIAGGLGALFFLRGFWGHIKIFLSGARRPGAEERKGADEGADDDDE